MNWYLTDFKKNNCMAVKDMFLLQVQTLSRSLREENGKGREDWKSDGCILNNRTCKQAEIQISGSSDITPVSFWMVFFIFVSNS